MRTTILLFLISLLGLIGCVATESRSPEKPFAYWIEQLKSQDLRTRADAGLHLLWARAREEELKKFAPELTSALGDECTWVVGGARQALKTCGEAAVPSLIRGLEDDLVSARYEAAKLLGEIRAKPELTIPALEKLLEDPDGKIRITAAGAIYGMDPKREPLMKMLVQALKSEDLKARLASLDALLRLGPLAEPAVPVIVELLAETKKEIEGPRNVQCSSTRVLGNLVKVSSNAVTALEHIYKENTDSRVRFLAYSGLVKLEEFRALKQPKPHPFR